MSKARPLEIAIVAAVGLIALASCGGAPSSGGASVEVMASARASSAGPSASSAPVRRNLERACPIVRAPVITSVEAPSIEPCMKNLTPQIEASVSKSLAADFTPSKGGKPEVTFACDHTHSRIREVIVERGAGHGFSLQLWQATASGDGASYDVVGVAYRGDGYVKIPAGKPHFQIAHGSIEASKLAPAISSARGALLANLREIVPPPPPGTILLGSIGSSSHDFHVLVRLVDEEGRALERRFTGYESPDDQPIFLSPRLAMSDLDPMLKAAPLADAEPTPEDRAFFADRFNATAPRFDDQFHWWVTERMVALAKDLGSPAVGAALYTRLSFQTEDRSKVDARADALEALARITGWDPRVGERGDTRSPEEAAAEYIQACSSSLSK